MCGINGFVSLRGRPIDPGRIEKMNKTISYRGPDDSGVYSDGPVGFGHLRLSILDLSPKGHQPMTYTHKGRTVVITYNGEVYNFLELRMQLQQKGYHFESETDTEVILAAYLEYGTQCVELFNGMFAFVIFDKEKQLLFGARDRFGKKPLKYYLDKEQFIFSSELKAILTHPIPREVDEEAVNEFLTLQYVPAPRTGFRDISKLEHAHYFILSLADGLFAKHRYFSLDYSQKISLSVSEWEDRIRSELTAAVSRRLISDVPVGAFLSGGIDSSAVVACMSKLCDQVKTFTISFKEQGFDESTYARTVADLYHTDHHEFEVGPKDLQSSIEDLIIHYEEPYADSSQLPTYLLSKQTRDYVTVALSGDGGDENFGGYTKHQAFVALRKHPFLVRLLQMTPAGLFPEKVQVVREFANASMTNQYFNLSGFFDEVSKRKLYARSKHFLLGRDRFAQELKHLSSYAIADQVMWLDFNHYLPDDLNVKMDMASMRHALEVRAPFLDYTFVSLMAQMPPALKISGGQGKKILRSAFAPLLPPGILNRRKHGFSVPLNIWFQGELFPYVSDHLRDKESVIYEFFDYDHIQEFIQRHLKYGRYGKRLWALLALDIWYKAYFR